MSSQSPLVLIVDDDRDFREMTRWVLESGGYRVACAADPQSALTLVSREQPALVITDLMMGAMSAGFSLSRTIKESPSGREVPVIIVTAAGSRAGYDFVPRGAEDLAAMHADAFVEKPWLPENLLAEVARLLAGRAGEKAS